jgi:hypothetical protein
VTTLRYGSCSATASRQSGIHVEAPSSGDRARLAAAPQSELLAVGALAEIDRAKLKPVRALTPRIAKENLLRFWAPLRNDAAARLLDGNDPGEF